MEHNNKFRLKALLTFTAAILLGLHLVGLISHQPSITYVVIDPTRSGMESIAAEVAQITSACTATVRVDALNQRNGPGESYAITGTAARGEVFTVSGWDDAQQWVHVPVINGTAWMSARYMTLSGDCNATAVKAATAPTDTAQAGGVSSVGVAMTGLSPVFTPEVQFWATEIAAWAELYQMDANLIATVIQIESCGNPSISSSAGAQGLFQVMPFHFAAGEDMLDVQTNANRGLTYLQGAIALSNGDAGLALVGYNGGYGAISGRWAAETQRYYYWGSGIYTDAISGATTSDTLQEWLAAGGSRLCASASQSQKVMLVVD